MDPMTGEGTNLGLGSSAGTGGMRIVMVNARTAVLVPVDAPDPAAPDDAPGWTDDGGADDPADDATDSSAAQSEQIADDRNAFSWVADDETSPEVGADLSAVADDVEDRAPSDTPSAALPMADAPAGPSTDGDAAGGEGDPHWRNQLLSRLDDLGRLLSRALPTPDQGLAPLTAALHQLETRMETAISGIEGRLDRLEQTIARGTDRPDMSGGETDEAISDLRMQLRMVEVQVGALGRLLVTGSADEATGSDAMRTRLAELVAREQQLATGS